MRKVLAFAIEYFYIENQCRVSAFSFLFILFADKYPLSNESANGINQPILKCQDERWTTKAITKVKKKNESNRNNMSIAHRRFLKVRKFEISAVKIEKEEMNKNKEQKEEDKKKQRDEERHTDNTKYNTRAR